MRRASPPLPHRRGRLEIVPLIDIMFFLLAAFMVVSIGKIHLKSLKLSLPTDQTVTQKEAKEDFINIAVTADGTIQLGKELIANKDQLMPRLQDLYAKNKDQKFLISADKDARHGDVVAVLAKLRAAGFQKVGFSISGDQKVTDPQAVTQSTAPQTVGTQPTGPQATVPQSAVSQTTVTQTSPPSAKAPSTTN